MRVFLFFLLFFSLNIRSQEQELDNKLNSFTSIAEAKSFIEENKELGAEIFSTFREEGYEREVGEIFNIELFVNDSINKDYRAKLLEIRRETFFRVSYIAFDASKMPLVEINRLREKIIEKFKNKVPFSELVEEYTMESDKTSDTGWSSWGEFIPEFESEIPKHHLNEIFKLDAPRIKMYYIILKTYNETIKEYQMSIGIPVKE